MIEIGVSQLAPKTGIQAAREELSRFVSRLERRK